MERLTKDDLNKVCYDPWEICGMDKHCTKGCHEEGGCTGGCHILKMHLKLAEYEDAEENGMLIKLPCRVGDTVYEVQEARKRIQPQEIVSVNVYRTGEINFGWELKDGKGMYVKLNGFNERDIGKTVFLTREAAEQALKQMGE